MTTIAYYVVHIASCDAQNVLDGPCKVRRPSDRFFLFYFDSSRKGEGEGVVKADCFENQKQNTKQNKKQKQRGGEGV